MTGMSRAPTGKPRERGRQGDLQRVYRDHVGAAFAFFSYSVPGAVAEDLTSATFERVVRSWHRYDSERASERTWILAIARNVLTDHFRRTAVRQAESLDARPALAELHASCPSDISRILDADELRCWLACLNTREREVLALRYGADLEASQIGAMLGLSTENVHQIASRSLRKLRATASAPATDGTGISDNAPRSA